MAHEVDPDTARKRELDMENGKVVDADDADTKAEDDDDPDE